MKYKNGKRITRLESFPKNVQIPINISEISQIVKIKVHLNMSYVTTKWTVKYGHIRQVVT